MNKSLLVVGAFLMFGLIVVPALSVSFADASVGSNTVDDEMVTLSNDEWTPVSQSQSADSFYDNETVTHEGDTVPDSDYDWRTDDGSIRATSEDLDGEAVSITYSYSVDDEFLELSSGVLWFIILIVASLTLVAGGMFVVGTIASISSIGGGGGR